MTIIKVIPLPQGLKVKLLTKRRESITKNVDKAFGVLQARFTIIYGPTRYIDKTDLDMIIKAFVILHNMIVEDECDLYDLAYDYDHVEDNTAEPNVRRDHHSCYVAYLHRVARVHDLELG